MLHVLRSKHSYNVVHQIPFCTHLMETKNIPRKSSSRKLLFYIFYEYNSLFSKSEGFWFIRIIRVYIYFVSLVYKNYFLVELTDCLRKTEESSVILGNVLRCNKFAWPQDIYHSRMQELTIKVFEVN